jgi:hypothetical protein
MKKLLIQFRDEIDGGNSIINIENKEKIRYCFPSIMYDDLMSLDDIEEVIYDGYMALHSNAFEKKYHIAAFCPLTWFNGKILENNEEFS